MGTSYGNLSTLPETAAGGSVASENIEPILSSDQLRVVQVETPSRASYHLMSENGKEDGPFNSFLDAVALRGLSKRTQRTYAYCLLSIGKWLQSTRRSINDLTEPHLAEYICYLRESAAVAPVALRRDALALP